MRKRSPSAFKVGARTLSSDDLFFFLIRRRWSGAGSDGRWGFLTDRRCWRVGVEARLDLPVDVTTRIDGIPAVQSPDPSHVWGRTTCLVFSERLLLGGLFLQVFGRESTDYVSAKNVARPLTQVEELQLGPL